MESSLRRLAEEERVGEIARIMGGITVTDRQREAAAELLRERHTLSGEVNEHE